MRQRNGFFQEKWQAKVEHDVQTRVPFDQHQRERIGHRVLHHWVQRTTRDCVLSKFLYHLLHHFFSDNHTVKLSANEMKTIEVSVMFACTAKLQPSKARIWCAIRNERSSCNLLGIEARSEMSPYISCDDLKLEEERGGGAYRHILSSFSASFRSDMERSTKENMSFQLSL